MGLADDRNHETSLSFEEVVEAMKKKIADLTWENVLLSATIVRLQQEAEEKKS